MSTRVTITVGFFLLLTVVILTVYVARIPPPSETQMDIVALDILKANESEREFHPTPRTENLTTTRKPEVKKQPSHFWPKFPLTAKQCQNVTFVTTASNGRLGNRIGEYTTLFSYGRLYGKIPVVTSDLLDELLPLFPHLTVKLFNETGCPPREWKNAGINLYGQVVPKWNESEFVADKDVRLYGYPIDFGLFHRFKSDWMSDFKFNSILEEQVQNFLSSLSAQYGPEVTYVGIHVRLTDQTKAYRDKFGAEPLTPAYFRRAMSLYGRMFPRVVFILASDDVNWCKENIKSVSESLPIVFVEGRGRDFDFSVLCHCNHSIISYGSFSFFTAYFAGGLAITPRVISQKVLPNDAMVIHLDNWIFITN